MSHLDAWLDKHFEERPQLARPSKDGIFNEYQMSAGIRSAFERLYCQCRVLRSSNELAKMEIDYLKEKLVGGE
jgi:hypothetical protein